MPCSIGVIATTARPTYEAALPDLEAVIARNGTHFMESALYGASDILFRDKRWEGALEYYRKLEPVASFPGNTLAAQVGQMRCLKELGRMAEAATAAERVAANSNATADLKADAGLTVAHGLLAKGDERCGLHQVQGGEHRQHQSPGCRGEVPHGLRAPPAAASSARRRRRSSIW
jgi:tetratricopeptide (TPR) repeat protein